MNGLDCIWVSGEIGTVVIRAAGRCVAKLESGKIAVIKLAESADDPHPWITKVVSIDLFEPRAGAMRRAVADNSCPDALSVALNTP
ncbi:hypothetical protein PHYC_02035 [Phycisphaerales bacterium]|nr:hypothetical protein PHYC_02035 [Phycisphaerales bacterium]